MKTPRPERISAELAAAAAALEPDARELPVLVAVRPGLAYRAAATKAQPLFTDEDGSPLLSIEDEDRLSGFISAADLHALSAEVWVRAITLFD